MLELVLREIRVVQKSPFDAADLSEMKWAELPQAAPVGRDFLNLA